MPARFLDRSEIRARQLSQLRALVRELETNPFYAPKLAAAGITPGIASLEDFSASMPFTTKDELAADHDAHPPFGSNLTYPISRYTRFNHTSGTTGSLMRWLDTPESWDWMLYNWELVMEAAGVKRGDRAFFAFSFGPFIGFWTAFGAAARMGCLCIPGGALNTVGRLQAVLDNEVTILCCSPTYAIRMGEAALEEGLDLGSSRVRLIIVAGEPGGSVPATRERIEKLWPGARVFDHHGMTEVGPATFECPEQPCKLHIIEGSIYAEILHPDTHEPVGPGEIGELVLTTLGRTGSPVLRYRSGDAVRGQWGEVCACGRHDILLDGGILSRLDDMIVVRGVNVYPSAVEHIVRRHPEVAEYRVEIRSKQGMDDLELQLEPAPGSDAAAVAKGVEKELRAVFSMRIPVKLVEPDSLPRFEIKSRRWVRV